MQTPIYDFVQNYIKKSTVRGHMPGHKGKRFLGCEPFDITEICGADALYEAEGIIAASEKNAAAIFNSGRTFLGTEGSSQMIKAMLALVAMGRDNPVVLAARNVHKAFVYGCALCGIAAEWLYDGESSSLCRCLVSPAALRQKLTAMKSEGKLPAAVYVTSPDYLGNMQDIGGLAAVCDNFGVPLLVDNAHGAYLKFLPKSNHPLDFGTYMCCDSAHKTLPVLTGGAYLHMSSAAAAKYGAVAKNTLCLFGSTSPSYLALQSLDLCNAYLTDGCCERLRYIIGEIDLLKDKLRQAGYEVLPSDPLKLTLCRLNGGRYAEILRAAGVECEYADCDNLVLMFTAENCASELQKIGDVLLNISAEKQAAYEFSLPVLKQAMSIRRAVFADYEIVDLADAVGRVCSMPLVGCPPAVPVVISGELIEAALLPVFRHYGIKKVAVVKDKDSADK